jgi:hypothetical protein
LKFFQQNQKQKNPTHEHPQKLAWTAPQTDSIEKKKFSLDATFGLFLLEVSAF